jgi:hypothetical protein
MTDNRPNTVFGGCLGSLIGGVAGGALGSLLAQIWGLKTNGSAFLLALDLLGYFCVGGGFVIGAIVGREIGRLVQRRSQRNQ